MISPAVRQSIELIRPLLDQNLAAALAQHWDCLPKAPGSLGRLEQMVLHYGLIRGTADPTVQRKGLYVFCADHGVVQQGVTADAQDATLTRMRQFLRGGSAAQVLCRQAQVETVAVNAGINGPEEPGALNFAVSRGSGDITRGPAMTETQVNAALEIGLRLAEEAARRFDLVGLGQIGVGGSIAASAMLSAFTGRGAAETTRKPACPDENMMNRRVQVVHSARIRNQHESISPYGTLRCLGGLDIAAMTGFLLGAAARRLPVIAGGFCEGAAALAARGLAPDSLDAVMFAHQEPDGAHQRMLAFLGVEPMFDLELREGGGFSAALGIQLLDSGLRLYREMRDADGEV